MPHGCQAVARKGGAAEKEIGSGDIRERDVGSELWRRVGFCRLRRAQSAGLDGESLKARHPEYVGYSLPEAGVRSFLKNAMGDASLKR